MSCKYKSFDQYRKAFSAQYDTAMSITERIQSGVNPRDIDGYLDHGATYDVFRMDRDLVIKIPRENDKKENKLDPAERIRQSVEALAPCAGRAGLEQLVSFSLEGPCALVCKYAPVVDAFRASDEQIATLNTQKFRQLFRNFEFLQKNNVSIDPCANNVRLNPQYGFTLIDVVHDRYAEAGFYDQSFGDKVVTFGTVMLFDGNGEELPEIGYMYRKACHDLIAPEMALALDEEWRTGCNLLVA